MSTFGKTVLYVVYGVIVAGLIVAVVASFHHTSNQPKHQSNGSSSSQSQTQSKPQAQSQKSQPQSSSSSQSSSSQAGSSTPQPGATSTSSTPSRLNNTGPGDTLLIFAGAAALGVVLYRRYLILRSAE